MPAFDVPTLEQRTPRIQRAKGMARFQKISATSYDPDGWPLIDGYTCHHGLYSENLKKHERRERMRGRCLVAVHDGVIVASARLGWAMTVPGPLHRGKGVMSSLYAELLKRWPDEASRHYQHGLNLTVGGEAMLRRAWDLVDGG